MSTLTIKQLLEAGVHFGHQTQRWNPKMKKYIFGERNGIYIINLEITLTCLQKALDFLKKTASEGREILLVGTKRQAQDPLRLAAERCNMPYVEQRWLGGMLTNFETVRKSVARLEYLEKMESDGSFKFVTKKEAAMLKKEREKLLKNLKGVRHMRKLPGALFVIDSKKEEIAIREAAKLGIPIVAVLDTNSDPDMANYPVPGNDDAIRAIRLFCDVVADTILQGRQEFEASFPKQQPAAEQETEEAEQAVLGSADSLPAGDVINTDAGAGELGDVPIPQMEDLKEENSPEEEVIPPHIKIKEDLDLAKNPSKLKIKMKPRGKESGGKAK